MPNWKKVIVSGSDASLNSVFANSITASIFSGSFQGTSSWATNALTASSADNFTVRGTLTAQTIVTQVITSSTDFVTGSTRFGSLISNTHQFTGSVSMTGSLTVAGHTVGRGGGYLVENTVLGFEALGRNTSATRNTAIGWYAISSSTTNGSNTAVGAVSQRFNTGGTGNSSLGEGSLFFVTTGNYNTAVGFNSLSGLTNGTYNIGMGSYAGAYITGGAIDNTTSDFGVYLGYAAYASQSDTQNEIVIGANNVGHGSNTVTLGNSSITRTILRGTVSASGDISGSNLYATSDVVAQQNLKSINSVGDEGGEILLAKPQTNTTLTGSGVTIDIYQNRLRFFEQGGAARGYFIDITGGGAGVSTNLVGGGGGTPGGSTTQIQYNNGGAFGGVPTLTYDGTTLRVTGSFTGSLTGSLLGTATTASYILQAVSASFATLAQTANTASFVTTAQTASFVTTAQTASYVLQAVSASNANLLDGLDSTVFATTGSNTFRGNQTITGSLSISGSIILAPSASIFTPSGSSGASIFIGSGGVSSSFGGVAGLYNYGYGTNALASVTFGESNIAIGFNALSSSTTSQRNIAIGSYTLASAIDGVNNVAIGENALQYASASAGGTAGNVAVGGSAGRFFGINTPNTGSANSIYLGYVTKTGQKDASNEIVIGFNATGLGSNTVVLGNSSITTTILRGKVGIGTTSPVNVLDVVGNVSASWYTGSLFGTASFATSASWAPGGGGGGISFPYTGSAVITGSLVVTGSTDLGIARFNSTSSATTAGTTIVSSNATASYNSAFYNYYISSGSNARAGQIMSVWSGSTINYTEVTTTDIGNTNTASFAVTLATGNVRLSFTAPGVWTVKSIANLL
jgi:hypothetical protein